MQKSALISMLNKLPNNFTFNEFVEQLLVVEKINLGLEEAKKGKTVSHKKVKKMVTKWAK